MASPSYGRLKLRSQNGQKAWLYLNPATTCPCAPTLLVAAHLLPPHLPRSTPTINAGAMVWFQRPARPRPLLSGGHVLMHDASTYPCIDMPMCWCTSIHMPDGYSRRCWCPSRRLLQLRIVMEAANEIRSRACYFPSKDGAHVDVLMCWCIGIFIQLDCLSARSWDVVGTSS